MGINFRKFFCGLASKGSWLYRACDCQRYEPRVDALICLQSSKVAGPHCAIKELRTYIVGTEPIEICNVCEPTEPPPPEWPQAPDYGGPLIGTTAYSLIRFPVADIEWFLRELVRAGGNVTEVLLCTTWDDTWKWQPFEIVQWETEKWRDKPWAPRPDYPYPVFDLNHFDERVWAKWEIIFDLCKKMGITVIVRVQDYCSRKDNFLERHWAFWSCVQSWRWGGWMRGGYLHWPIGEGGMGGREFIWPFYDRLNGRLMEALETFAGDYYVEPWNELHVDKGAAYDPTAPDELTINVEVHKWFINNLVGHGCPAGRIICNSQQTSLRKTAEYLAHVTRLKALGAIVEHHGCASPQKMTDYAARFGSDRLTFPNGDGQDKDAGGINDGRPYYTEPSVAQAQEMGRLIRQHNLFGYIYKNRSLRGAASLCVADFSALSGLRDGLA